jgi:type III restriction enzyme
MQRKELLLTLPERSPDPKAQVAFIFAHSALKEGWDNPNVFQICTLNQTKSDRKKRQEIGRGLRIAVNQSGERVLDEEVNILTVIANESYESYVKGLQKNYEDDDRLAAGERPPAPSNASKGQVHRNEEVFGMQEFKTFWDKLSQRVRYRMKFDEARFIQDAVAQLNHVKFPLPKIVTQRGAFVQSQVTIKLLELDGADRVRLRVEVANTQSKDVEAVELSLNLHQDLADKACPEHLKGEKFILHEIHRDHYADNSYLRFRNGLEVGLGQPLSFRSFGGQRTVTGTPNLKIEEQYPVFDIISRAARETKLTKRTINTIFSKISQDQVKDCLLNPEGFTEKLVDELKKLVAHHIAASLEFEVSGTEVLDLTHYFPEKPSFVQYRLEDAGENSIYDRVQIDSEVENRFMSNRLRDQREVIFYFKFPRSYKISLPKMIHDYNPDWGVLYEEPDGTHKIELIRETKGSTDKDSLRFHGEGLKITCAEKYYDLLGIDYRVVTDEIPEWWQKEQRVRYVSMDFDEQIRKAAEGTQGE